METMINANGVECIKTQHIDSGTIQWLVKEEYERNTKIFKLVSGVETHAETTERASQEKTKAKGTYVQEIVVVDDEFTPEKPKVKPVQKGNTKVKVGK
ncbi:MAG: hypothetical protein KAS32_25205 [Candidatus Peribacteraceae bacterium]|nr:hypothetical protein [Candidatus Peribacteraceae bacterium]